MVHSCKCSHRSPVHLSAAATLFSFTLFSFVENGTKETAAADDTKFRTRGFSLSTVTLKLTPNVDTAAAVSLAKHAFSRDYASTLFP